MRLAVVVFLIASLGVTPALADDKAKAAAHYKQGNAYRKANQYDKAIAEFAAAYAYDNKPIHLSNIADAYLAKKDVEKAIEYYEKYLVADPATKRGAEIRGIIAALTKQKAEADAKKKADEEAARLAVEKKRVEQEQANKKTAATSRVKQAEAYEQAGTWTKAGDEHRAAFAIDGDVAHLLAAAAAYRKQPDLGKAREAYLAYLEKVPLGAESDKVRGEVAAITREIEKADEADRQRRLRLEEGKLADERRRKDEAAKLVIIAAPPRKPRKTSIGAELRGGIYSSGKANLESAPSVSGGSIESKPGTAVGVGAFIDFPLLTASHVHVGVRARSFKSEFRTEQCVSMAMCPSKAAAVHVGPAITLEPSLYHRGRLDVYAVLGLAFNIGTYKLTFVQTADDREISIPQPEGEFGLGGRFGPVSVNVTFQISLTKLSNLGLTLGGSPGAVSGVLAAASWTLPR